METTAHHRRLPWMVVGALALAVGLVGAVVGMVIASEDDDGVAPAAGSQIASVQRACEQWMGSDSAPSDQTERCRDMARWMSDHTGRYDMGPGMMWADPERMRTTCQQWMSDSPHAGIDDPETWCDGMVDWMSDHMQDWSGRDHWDDWEHDGPMMDR